MHTSAQTNDATERILHHGGDLFKPRGHKDLRSNSANYSPGSREFGSGGDLIALFATARAAASRSFTTESVAAAVVQQPEFITTKAKRPVI
jgi:hypothetical protein